MEKKNIRFNNYLNENKTNKNSRRRSSIRKSSLGKSLKRLSFHNKVLEEEFSNKIPSLQKVGRIKSNMKSIHSLSKKFTILIIFINFILPGVGTMISCIKIDDIKVRRGFYALGFCSFITSPILIGYFLSFLSSFFFYKCYLSHLSIERFLYSINKNI